jgi:hypothetical protein
MPSERVLDAFRKAFPQPSEHVLERVPGLQQMNRNHFNNTLNLLRISNL